ncbi:MAG: hypothetical protein EBU90_01635 [Proteobacteria bacterium]|nr:hypothetical protein [Pseudomonadota bacterium]
MSIFSQNFYRVNSNNIALATSATGGAANDPTESLAPLSLKSGTITCTTGSATITGSGTSFTSQLAVGDAILTPQGLNIGVVSVIASDTSLTLLSNAKVAVTGSLFIAGNNLAILPGDSILWRIQVIKGAGNTSVTFPNLQALRRGTAAEVLLPNAYTNKSYVEFFSEGVLGTNDVSASGTSLECGLENYDMTLVPPSTGPGLVLATGGLTTTINPNLRLDLLTYANFPNYLWYLINPFARTTELLASGTKYSIKTTDDLPALTISGALSNLQDTRSHYIFVSSDGTQYRKY